MRIAIVSDTHIGQRLGNLPPVFYNLIDKPDVIIHAGDFTNVETLKEIQGLAESFYGVVGNMDNSQIGNMLPKENRFELNGVTFGLIHGWGAAGGLQDRVFEHFKDDKPQIIIFGHSHVPLQQKRGNTLLLNPGCVSGNLFSNKGSLVLMELSENGEFEIERKEFKI